MSRYSKITDNCLTLKFSIKKIKDIRLTNEKAFSKKKNKKILHIDFNLVVSFFYISKDLNFHSNPFWEFVVWSIYTVCKGA